MTVTAVPRLALGAERGGSGKTTLSIGLLSAWRRRGWTCAAFKKGPDYIDAAWLTAAAGRPCRNLDAYLMDEEVAAASFHRTSARHGLNLIEGARGLFDGVDPEGSYSTAELAKQLAAPVVLVLDCQKQTATAAAVALGCLAFDPDLRIAGVILNRVGTARQERVVRAAVEQRAGLPVLGAVPRLRPQQLRERHLGLQPPQEMANVDRALAEAADLAEEYLDLDGLRRVAESAPALKVAPSSAAPAAERLGETRIGYFRDAAFHFYYPENQEALESHGAEMVAIDATCERHLPADLDGLYIGGGFPESRAEALADNDSMRRSVRNAATEGLPIYAECGGLIYLGERLNTCGASYPMAGVFPVSFFLEEKPQGHGYVTTVAREGHPFLPRGTRMRGHEFHYTRPVEWEEGSLSFGLGLERGRGFDDGRDGLTWRNTLATYAHVHALGEPAWARGFVDLCLQYRRSLDDTSHSSRIAPGGLAPPAA